MKCALEEVLGIKIWRGYKGLYLSTRKGEQKVIEEFEKKNSIVLSKPLPPGAKLPSPDQVSNTVEITKDRRLLGKILYLFRYVRYDFRYPINLSSRYSSMHNEAIWALQKNALRYLKGTELELPYLYIDCPDEPLFHFIFWSDDSYADSTTKWKSTIGRYLFWYRYIIGWSSTKTKHIAFEHYRGRTYCWRWKINKCNILERCQFGNIPPYV